MPLVLSIIEAVRAAVAHALCVELPHCEMDGVKLVVCVALEHRVGEGVWLVEAQDDPV